MGYYDLVVRFIKEGLGAVEIMSHPERHEIRLDELGWSSEQVCYKADLVWEGGHEIGNEVDVQGVELWVERANWLERQLALDLMDPEKRRPYLKKSDIVG